MLLPLFLLALCSISYAEKRIYHTFNQTVLDEDEYKEYVDQGVAPFCTIEIEDCDPTEGRRLDGSCNNLRYPAMGAARTPLLRFLPAEYADGLSEPRKAESGEELPNGREVRTKLMFDGRISDRVLTNLVPIIWTVFASDSIVVQDTINYMYTDPPCCSAEGKDKNRCLPIEIPVNDPVHRFSGMRCINMTKPMSYQNTGCLANGTMAEERTSAATPLLDLSLLYGNNLKGALEKTRMYEDGLIKYEEYNGNMWPPNNEDYSTCTQNVAPYESRCHDLAETSVNGLLGQNIPLLWYFRQHNHLAKQLKELNPCWDDEKLFYTVRDINIALSAQHYYYELLPLVLGETNMINQGVISADAGFRDIHDENVLPQITMEYLHALRWMHTITEGNLRLYDNAGNYYKNFPLVNTTFRTGWLAVDDNIAGVTRGLLKQGAGKAGDNVAEPDFNENGLGAHSKLHDILALDNLKSRYLGFKPYIHYLNKCFGKTYSTFDDLSDVISEEKIELLRNVYKSVIDIDLMAGIWMENNVEGGHSPPTFGCLLADQLKRNIISDRHWYERQDRPNAFTLEQLQQIRKTSVASLVCNFGDNITEIQPRPLERPGPGNEISGCDKIQGIDIRVWKDDTCSS